MGIRPQFYILVGIDDAKPKDPRRIKVDKKYVEDILNFRELTEEEAFRNDDGWDDYYQVKELKVTGMTMNMNDIVYNPRASSEYRVGNVVGLIIDHSEYDSDIMRAFAAIDDKYIDRGWQRIPTIDPKEHPLAYRHYGYTEEDVANNMFVPSVFENMPGISRVQWARAQHYLKLVGWDIPKSDLRYLLVWDWS